MRKTGAMIILLCALLQNTNIYLKMINSKSRYLPPRFFYGMFKFNS